MSEIQKKLQEFKDQMDQKIESSKKDLAKDFHDGFINALQTPGVNAYMAKNRPLSKRGTTEKEAIAKALEVLAFYGADITFQSNKGIGNFKQAPIDSNTGLKDIEDFIIDPSIVQINISFKPDFE